MSGTSRLASGTNDLESRIETKATEHARQLGMLSLKLNVKGQIGWPDRLYCYRGETIFVEYKAVKEKPRAMQLHIHEQLRGQHIRIFVVDNLIDARYILNKFKEERDALYAAQVPAGGD